MQPEHQLLLGPIFKETETEKPLSKVSIETDDDWGRIFAFALFCKETGFATLYGTHSAGDGISDFPIYYILPNSKLLDRFTPGMGIEYTGRANEEVRVQPDVF
jgi:hypothetical protein